MREAASDGGAGVGGGYNINFTVNIFTLFKFFLGLLGVEAWRYREIWFDV